MEEKKNKITTIIAVISTICAVIFGVLYFTKNNSSSNSQQSYGIPVYNIQTGEQEPIKTEKELKDNIMLERLGIAVNGDFVIKAKNNNNEDVYINNINVVFKDNDGNFIEKETCSNKYFAIGANEEIVTYINAFEKDFSEYSNYEFELELSRDYRKKESTCQNFEITSNNTGKQISVQIKNNNDTDVKDIKVVVAYYKEGKIVGVEDGYEFNSTSANGTAYLNVEYPEDSKYNKIAFDDYKTYLLIADIK